MLLSTMLLVMRVRLNSNGRRLEEELGVEMVEGTSVLLAIAVRAQPSTCVGVRRGRRPLGTVVRLRPPSNRCHAGRSAASCAALLISAYAFIWAAVMVYIWTRWIRMAVSEADIRAHFRGSLSAEMPRLHRR